MENQLQRLNFPYVRLHAVDGSTLLEPLKEIDPNRFLRCHGREVRRGEIGCYLSHINALKRFLESDCDFGLILEDDAFISEEAANIIKTLVAKDAPRDWDLLKLQSRRSTKVFQSRTVSILHFLAIPFTRSTGATAYIVNRRAATNMVNRLLPIEVPYDHAFDRPSFLGIRCRAIYPFPVVLKPEHSCRSTIETSAPIKQKGLKKLHALCWRIKSEVSRVIWAVKEVLKERIFRSNPSISA